jgi:hypothetical protein
MVRIDSASLLVGSRSATGHRQSGALGAAFDACDVCWQGARGGVGVPSFDESAGSEVLAGDISSAPDAPGGVDSQVVVDGGSGATRRASVVRQLSRVVEAIRKGDDEVVQELVLGLSRQRRIFAPLAFVVGAIAMLFEGVKLLETNWRLALVQLLPAMWIWAAMLDLKAHVLHGKSLVVLRGPILIPIVLGIVVITAASFFLNAVFAFAISKPGRPEIRPAFTQARRHHRAVLGSGVVIGLLLGFSTVVVVRGARVVYG